MQSDLSLTFRSQIVGGLGVGVSFQVPVMLIQATTKEADVPLTTATLLCMCTSNVTSLLRITDPSKVIQTLGGAFGVSAAQTAFQNILVKRLAVTAAGLDPAIVLHAGATEIRKSIPAEYVEGVLKAYVSGFRGCLIVAIAFGGAAFFAAFGFRFTTIKKTTALEG